MRASVVLAVVAFALVFASASASGQCPRPQRPDHAEAVRLATEADKIRTTNIDDAIAKYEEATKLDLDDHRLWWKLALAYDRKEDWAKVASACAMAEAADAKTFGKKTHANYYARHGVALARVAARSGGWDDAIAPLETAVAIDPNYADAYGELGSVRAQLDDDVGAMSAWMQAIAKSPETMRHYVAVADLYRRWMFFDHAEQVLVVALSFAKADDKEVYAVHSLLGGVYLLKGSVARAVTEYEAAKKSCAATSCVDHREASYGLGVAYAALIPPRKSEAIQELQIFWKTVCKGALAQRYADACADALETARRLGGSPQ